MFLKMLESTVNLEYNHRKYMIAMEVRIIGAFVSSLIFGR